MEAKRCPSVSDDSFVDLVLEHLEGLGEVDARRMFGAHGLYAGDTFFAIVDDGRLYFHVDDETREAYEAQGMGPFTPNEKQVMRSYYEVPADIIEDPDELVTWAERAVASKG